jgi:hypothetical protein
MGHALPRSPSFHAKEIHAMPKSPLSERQLDRRNVVVPALDPEDIQESHTGERVTLINVGHGSLGGYDNDGRRFDVASGQKVTLTSARAEKLLRGDTPGKFEVYDPKKHDKKEAGR